MRREIRSRFADHTCATPTHARRRTVDAYGACTAHAGQTHASHTVHMVRPPRCTRSTQTAHTRHKPCPHGGHSTLMLLGKQQPTHGSHATRMQHGTHATCLDTRVTAMVNAGQTARMLHGRHTAPMLHPPHTHGHHLREGQRRLAKLLAVPAAIFVTCRACGWETVGQTGDGSAESEGSAGAAPGRRRLQAAGRRVKHAPQAAGGHAGRS